MKYISILRGINVGGKRKILMNDLKSIYSALGFTNVSTYIQSGNVFFTAKKQKAATLEKKISKAILDQFGFEVPVIIRTVEEIKLAINQNPYLKEKNVDIKKLYLTFLSHVPKIADVTTLKEKDYSPDKFEIIDNHAFIFCASGKYHLTKLNNHLFEKKLHVNATTRNWKTVSKLLELGEK